MKQLKLFVLLWMPAAIANAQDFTVLKDIEIKTAEECRTYDPKALECASFILSSPYKKEDQNRLHASAFLIKWMTASPDYTFEIDKSATELTKKNDALIITYMAAMTKYSLENKRKSKDAKAVKLGSIHLFLEYCKNEVNDVKLTKEIKKAIEADSEGKLNDYLKL
jgi:hypothetical protein